MAHVEMSCWCDAACRCIRFRPDRPAVHEELMEHLRDGAEALEQAGLDPEEAARQAVENMGDPVQVGRALNRGHSPVVGWLWVASRWALGLALAALVVAGLPWSKVTGRYTFTREEWAEAPYIQQEYDRSGENYWGVVHPTDAVNVGDYTFAVDRAVRRRWDGADTVFFNLQATSWKFWRPGPDLLSRLYAVESTGRVIRNRIDGYWSTDPEVSGNRVGRDRPGLAEYGCWVTGVSPKAQWVEICFDDFGRSFRLRIPLEGAVEGEA